MNKEWSDLCKLMQQQIRKKDTYEDGITTLGCLRNKLMEEMLRLRNTLERKDFDAMPFINAKGYHSKNAAYSIWHIFRIEDIVAHTLVSGDEQIFFKGNYDKKINSPIITTGNELIKEQIADFSRALNINALYEYALMVKKSTEDMLVRLKYEDLRRKITEQDRCNLGKLNVVSTSEDAFWLIDYWCNKDVRGLIQMPFSRHWIMHVEAINRIVRKLGKE